MLRFWYLLILAAFLFFGCVTFGFGDYDKCGDKYYTAVNQVCEESVIKMQCSDKDYNPAIEICSNDVVKAKEEFVDNRDGKTYKYVTIGTQTWIAENLKHEVSNTKCYDNNPDNCETYGILYDWETAMKICPEGWHLPNDSEWIALAKFFDINPGTKLKANSSLWISGKGTDEFGFTALPGGFYRNDRGFTQIGEVSGFWSATEGSVNGSAHFRYFTYMNESLNLDGFNIDESFGWSLWGLANVRCVKD